MLFDDISTFHCNHFSLVLNTLKGCHSVGIQARIFTDYSPILCLDAHSMTNCILIRN